MTDRDQRSALRSRAQIAAELVQHVLGHDIGPDAPLFPGTSCDLTGAEALAYASADLRECPICEGPPGRDAHCDGCLVLSSDAVATILAEHRSDIDRR
jgi:hypothetical protein